MEFTEEQVKAVPGKEMKETLVSFNRWLAETGAVELDCNEMEKAEALKVIVGGIEKTIEDGLAGNLPDEVISFYNTYIASEEPEEAETTPEPETAKEPNKGKKEKAPKPPKEPKPPKTPKTKKVGKETLATDMLRAGKTDEEIWNTIYAMYPSNTDEEKAFAKKRADKYLSLGQLHFSKESPEYKAKLDQIKADVKAALTKVVSERKEKEKAEKTKKAGKPKTEKKAETPETQEAPVAKKVETKKVAAPTKKTTTVKKPTPKKKG